VEAKTLVELAGDAHATRHCSITSTLGSNAKTFSQANITLGDGTNTPIVIVVTGEQIVSSAVTPFDGTEIKVFPIKVHPVDVTNINILECEPSKVGFLSHEIGWVECQNHLGARASSFLPALSH
jgi:hypothetical protein